ncbi:hypothetical protein FPZ12_030445 [Amycolatopsis acidicola]|uniref:Uncharacterized protein n=1 Tax=Amycolatopsis acidicola TaxID=2596893 RepID=A0A5N0UT03_9PSEU|nr:hypothetical protein [Amycolatopsis acidicola]KAA9155163.1 hypothetical protein FPZ12_030445 [Amycolatopsis acidicola]
MTAVAVLCAALAAVCAAVGAKLQHNGVRAQAHGLRLGALARNRDWQLGLVVLTTCSVLQIVALMLAPVIVVAPLVVLALPVVALLGGEVSRAAAFGIGAISLSVGAFVAFSADAAQDADIPPAAVPESVQLIAVVMVLLGVAAFLSRGVTRCVALSTAAGVGYGLVSVLMRDVAYSLRTLGFAELPWLSLLGAVVAFAVAAWLVQLGHASGPPDVVVGCQTVANPISATALGMTVLGEARALAPGTLAAFAVCGVVAIAGIAVLSRRGPSSQGEKAHLHQWFIALSRISMSGAFTGNRDGGSGRPRKLSSTNAK